VLELRLAGGELVPPADPAPAGDLHLVRAVRDVARSPLSGPAVLRPPARHVAAEALVSGQWSAPLTTDH
jgi:hypothetical protein